MKTTDYNKAKELIEKYARIETALRHATPEQAVIIHKIHNRRGNSMPLDSVQQCCNRMIIDRLNIIAESMPSQGYSMGGEVRVRFSKLTGVYDNRESYAKSCKYRPTYGDYSVKLSLDELRNIQVVGGLVTYIFPNQRSKVKRCWWFSSKGLKNHFELTRVQGFLYGDYHSTNKDKAAREGKRIEENIRLQAKEKALKERCMRKALRLQYTFSDSLMAGNCEAGTRAFCMRLSLDATKSYRGNFLIKLATKKSTSSIPFVNRMIEYRVFIKEYVLANYSNI